MSVFGWEREIFENGGLGELRIMKDDELRN
jgi:hypothetical protein